MEAILKVVKEHVENVKVGKSLIVKPKRLNDFCITHTHKRITPQCAKLLNIAEPDEQSITNLKKKFKSSQNIEENEEKFTDKLGNTCDLSSKDPEFTNERRWAKIIIQHIIKIKQPFRLDGLTKGNGSCLMIAIMQQLRRKEIYERARPEVQELARRLDHEEFRRRINFYVTTSQDPRLIELKEFYNNSAETKSWDQYWKDMLGDTWASGHFIRASAIYLQFNIGIITTSQKEEDAPILMHCGLPDKDTLWLGNITDLHYQSILKDNAETMKNPVQESNEVQKEVPESPVNTN